MALVLERTEREAVQESSDIFLGNINIKSEETFGYINGELVYKTYTYNDGIYKLCKELLENCLDNSIKSSVQNKTTEIKININDDNFVFWNNGTPLSIEQRKTLDGSLKYNPELAFTKLYTSTNYKTKNRITTGKNGVGVKIVTIFSDKLIIDIVENKKHYHQVIEKGMTIINKPEITKSNSEDYVKITCYPNIKGVKTIDEDTKAIILKRCFDGVLYPVNITLNDVKYKHMNFYNFVKLHFPNEDLNYYSTPSRDFEVVLSTVDKKGLLYSYVNNVCTKEHGTHVNNFINQLKKSIKIEGLEIDPKSKLKVFLNQRVENPLFDAQHKEKLTTKVNCDLKLICDKIVKETDLIELLTNKLDKSKKSKTHSKHLIFDARYAGTRRSKECTLFITEGSSASGFISPNFSVIGHEKYGIFELTGKPLNVQKASKIKAINNVILNELIQAIGLDKNKKYTSVGELRYGHVVMVKDADTDGTNILALVMNIFYTYWPELLNMDFFSEFITPMFQIKGKKEVHEFTNVKDFNEFIKSHPNTAKTSIKYIKGLAANDQKDAKKYFQSYDSHIMTYELDDYADEWMRIAFDRNEKYRRKIWVQECNENTHLDRILNTKIPISDFIRYDEVLFSYDVCERSIPSVYDGLKPSQRKVLYTFLSKSEKESSTMKKVFQITGEVADKTNYLHGDSSMNGTIMAMMQTWSGSNNITLLGHSGQIGTRYGGGLDGGAPRYVECNLNPITRIIFPKADFPLLSYVEVENQKVEPKFYVPIIPMILINGCQGLGVGYRSTVPLHSQYDCIDYIKEFLERNERIGNVKKSLRKITTRIGWNYPDFKGEIVDEGNGYMTYGIQEFVTPPFEKDNFSKSKLIGNDPNNPLHYDPCFIKISEVPVGINLRKIKRKLAEFLSSNKKGVNKKKKKEESDEDISESEEEINKNALKNYLIDFMDSSIPGNDCNEEKIELYLKIKNPGVNANVENINIVPYKHKILTSTMMLFDDNKQIRHFKTIYDIMNEFIIKRYELYVKRKQYEIGLLEKDLNVLTNKARFIKNIVEEKVDVRNIKDELLVEYLEKERFDKMDGSYDYLVNLPIKLMTESQYKKLLKEVKELRVRIRDYQNKSVETIWGEELDMLEKYLTRPDVKK